jgi:hypothetical protein
MSGFFAALLYIKDNVTLLMLFTPGSFTIELLPRKNQANKYVIISKAELIKRHNFLC